MLSIIQKLKKLLISYVTTGFEFCCFNMLIMSVTVLPLSVPYVAPQKGAGVRLLECYHFKGTERVYWLVVLLEEELIPCALRTPPSHFF